MTAIIFNVELNIHTEYQDIPGISKLKCLFRLFFYFKSQITKVLDYTFAPIEFHHQISNLVFD